MKLILEAVFLILLVLLVLSFSGCSFSIGQKNRTEPIVTEAPPPEIQLWQAVKKSDWLVTMSILGIAGGVFAVMNGATKLGFASIAATSVSLVMSLAVARFALWLAVFGLIGTFAAVGFSILVRRRALVEMIKGVQVLKTKSRVILPSTVNDEMNDKQSSTTKVVVGNIKNELKLKGAL